MPIINDIHFSPPFFLRNNHIQTVVPSIFRSVPGISFSRERISTYDNDFIDIDWVRQGSEKCVIIIHGMEGHSGRPYVKGMIRALKQYGWDCAVLNLRGCSGEPNKKTGFYNAGMTEDLDALVQHIHNHYSYKKIVLAGFSLGGNLILKYLGENRFTIPSSVVSSVTISVPCDLLATVDIIDSKHNRLYRDHFIKSFIAKVLQKKIHTSDQLDMKAILNAKTIKEYDNLFTAPVHGYKNAEEYYEANSCKQFIHTIKQPSLLITAGDDPFLANTCYPHKEAGNNKNFYFLVPRYGGHVGFWGAPVKKAYWHEYQACTFLENYC